MAEASQPKETQPKEIQPKETQKKKRGAGPLIGALVAVALLVAAFFFGAQYFTAKRSTTATVCAAGLSEDGISVYRLSSGVLDKFSPEDQSSPTVKIPCAPQLTILNSSKKKVKPEAFSPGPGAEKVVAITINPSGQVCRIQELAGSFQVEGDAVVKGTRELQIGKTSYFVGGTLFLSSGGLTGKSGDDLEGYAETGDRVKVTGAGDQAVVLDILAKAGRVSVSSNVAGAKVYVDGSLRGKAPCVLTAAPGTREVAVKADGYLDRKFKVLVVSLTDIPLAADLVEATGNLNVSTTPLGASVYVSGELKGKTPFKVALRPGNYDVVVELAGYYSRSSQAAVIIDTDQSINLTLVRKVEDTGSETGAGTGFPAGGPAPGGSGTGAQENRLIEKGRVLARSGNVLDIGDKWTECVLASDVKVEYSEGDFPAGRIGRGDTVSAYGPSASDIKLVKVESVLGYTWPYEGFMVQTGSGYRVFGDDSVLKIDIQSDLEVVDPVNRIEDPAQGVPSGSRVRFYVDSSGNAVWAEYVWKAGVSVDGSITTLNGALIRVAPQWEDLYVSTATTVFVGDDKTAFYDIRTGDSVVVAGPIARDIRFIWIRNRVWTDGEVSAIAVSAASKSGTTLFEFSGSSVRGYPIYAGSTVTLSYPAEKKIIPVSDLQYGDRVKIKLDQNRQIAWGEVTLKDDTRFTGIFLGDAEGYYYFDSFRRFTPAPEIVIVGLAQGEKLQPGSRVIAAGTAGAVNYIEVQVEVNAAQWTSGTVFSSKDSLRVHGEWGIEAYAFGKETRFVDWVLRQDGLVTGLFPGDKVRVALGLGQPETAVWVERTYAPPFKLEGTIEAIDDRTLIVSDKVTRRTITLTLSAHVVKDGEETGITSLAVGDKVKASGKGKTAIDVLVVGW
jgi:hypothetical protein